MTNIELKKFRLRFNWSQKELANNLGCSLRSISNYERGKSKIPKNITLAISAVAMNLPPYKN